MRYAVLLVICGATASAQAGKPEETSNLAGRVVNAVTGQPIAKAAVILARVGSTQRPGDSSRNYTIASDAKGNFAIADIEAGSYRLRAARNGYLDLEYGAHGSQKTGTLLDLEKPQKLQDLELRMIPYAILTGRIVDADGEPVLGAQVQVLRSKYVNGKKVLALEKAAYSNDLGEYRMAGLMAGRYYVYAQEFEGPPTLAGSKEQYVPVYYPGSTDVTGAAPIDVGAGAEARVGNLMLRKTSTVTVKGKVIVELTGTSGVPFVNFGPAIGHNNQGIGRFRLPGVVKVSASGEFEARGLPPGNYAAMAQVGKDGISRVSQLVTVNVGTSDVDGVVLTIGEWIQMKGRIRVEGDAKVDLKSLRVIDRRGGPAGGGDSGNRVAEDGTFHIEESQPDRYGVSMSNLPDGYYTKSIRAGETDITYVGVDLRNGAPGTLDILVSPKAGMVAGVVQNGDTSKAAPGATVVMAPQEKERWQILEYYPQATSDQYGRFTFKSVPPGAYKVYAWEDVEPTSWLDPEFLKGVEGKGAAVKVGELDRQNVNVTVIGAEKEKK